MFRSSLAYSIIGLIVLAVIGTAIPLHYMQVRVLEQSLRTAEWARAESYHMLIKDHMERVGGIVSTLSRLLKEQGGLRSAMASFMDSGGFNNDGDWAPLNTFIKSLDSLTPIYDVIVTDPDGRIVAGNKAQEVGNVLSGWGVAEAMTGEDIVVTTFHDGRWEIRGVSPISIDGRPAGSVVVASRIDDRFAYELSHDYRCKASLGNLNGIFASALIPEKRNNLDTGLMIQALQEKTAKRKDYPGLSKTAYYGPLQVIDEIFCLIVEIDTSASDALLARKRKETFLFFLLILITSSVLGTLFALKLIRPIRKLKEKAQAIAKEIADERLEDVKGNEVKNLVHVFYSMIDAINHHIDQRRQAENELRLHSDKLEEQVSERTIHLKYVNDELNREINERKFKETALRESKEKLEESLRRLKETQAYMIQSEKMASVGQLAAGVAHEINNPTGFVSSNLNTLAEYQEDISKILTEYDELALQLKNVISNVGDLSTLSGQLERMRKMEADLDIDFIINDIPKLIAESIEGTGRIQKIVAALKDFAHPGEEESEYTDINSCIESTLNVIWNEIKYKADVTKEYGKLPMVRCHPQQINQVFMNLLVNAAHAMESRGEIKIITSADNGDVVISISDTGTGIPEKYLSRIFDPFFTTKKVGVGTGLGLHIAYDIINSHGGAIQVESVEGKGTTFTLRVPCSMKKASNDS